LHLKRIFDIVFSLSALLLFGWLVLLGFIIASIDTRSNGLFIQKRVGQFGNFFSIFKLKTMRPKTQLVSVIGVFLRKYKIDELPQFINVLLGTMSVVGPRPDIPGYYDILEGEQRKILELKPGITCPASLKYANEEELLGQKEDSIFYNDTVIFPDKVNMNLDYYYNNSFCGDIKIIWKTIFR
jgi:lipopolysaccharide/colanic/teichoic acid biosynthesis glycosyltransferase